MILNKEQFQELNKFFDRDNTMNIYSKIGSKVVFAYPENGDKWDIEEAQKYLTLGDTYTIEKIDIHNWKTDVVLKEFPEIYFNSVQFKNKEKEDL